MRRRRQTPAWPGRAALEPLETRVLLTFAPVGPEFRVNTQTDYAQSYPAVAADADGDFVVAWPSYGIDGKADIHAQRYSPAGVARGGEFVVNTTTAGDELSPAVAMDADGDFVIAWTSVAQPGETDVFAQRFDAAGAPRGGEFRVNAYTPGAQYGADVAMDADGNFIITWTSDGQYSADRDVVAKRYSGSGHPLQSDFLVNTVTAGDQSSSAVAAAYDGRFVVTWCSWALGQPDIRAQQFTAAGDEAGAEVVVNSARLNYQGHPEAAMDADGDFVIAWSVQQVPQTFDVYARRFNSAGAAFGEYRVNDDPAGNQYFESVAMDAAGGFIITWYAADADNNGVYAQRYSPTGGELGYEFRVNTVTDNNQYGSAIALDAEGDAVVAWTDNERDGSSWGVYAQRFNETVDAAGPVVADLLIMDRVARPDTEWATPVTRMSVNFSEPLDTDGGAAGAYSATNPANWKLLRGTTDVSSSIASVSFGLNAATNKYEAVLSIPQGLYVAGNYTIAARSTLRDPSVNSLDGDRDGHPGGGDWTRSFVLLNATPTTGGIAPVNVPEDAANTVIQLSNAFSDAEQPSRELTYSVTLNTNPALFSSTAISAAADTLTLDYAPNANGQAVMTVRATDSGGLFAEATFTVAVAAVNDAPTATSLPPVTVPEDAADTAVPLFGAFADVEQPDGALTYTIAANTNPSLFTSTLITASTGTLVLDYAPDANGVAALTVRATDAGGLYADTTFTVQVTAVNDPPVNRLPPAQYARPGRPRVFGRDNGNAITVADVDAGGSDVQVTLSAARGYELKPGTNAGVRVESPQPDVLRLIGPVAAVNGALDGLQLVPPEEGEGETELQVVTNDLGNTGSGGALQDTDSVRVTFYRAPRVSGVYLMADWTTFTSVLVSQGLGDPVAGYSVPAGPAQLVPVPWSDIWVVSLRFDGDVAVERDDLVVRRHDGSTYSMGFYSATPTMAIWFLPRHALSSDRLRLELAGGAGGVADLHTGVPLDGEWADGADAWPSGNGTPGSDFRFSINVLAGDATRDGRVTAADVLDVRRRMRRSAAAPGPTGPYGYSVFADIDGDAVVTARDLWQVRRAIGHVLPAVAAVAARLPTARRGEYLSATEILR